MDDRPGAAPARCRARPATTGSTRPARSASSSAPIPPKAVGHKLALLNRPGRFWLTAVTRFGKAQIVTSDMVGQEGDVLVFVCAMDALDELQAHIEPGGEH